eukprot:gene4511-4835_t
MQPPLPLTLTLLPSSLLLVLLLTCSAFSIPFRSHSLLTTPIRASPQDTQVYGPNNFGDIISDRSVNIYINGNFTPIERIVLSANGNLQRILSAYHGTPVHIDVLKCVMLDSNTFHREVNLMIGDRKLGSARGEIQVNCERCLQDISSKKVGVGQLFRYLGVLPSFKLLAVGRVSSSSDSSS